MGCDTGLGRGVDAYRTLKECIPTWRLSAGGPEDHEIDLGRMRDNGRSEGRKERVASTSARRLATPHSSVHVSLHHISLAFFDADGRAGKAKA